MRPRLDDLLREAQRFEIAHLDRTLRNTLIILALWEVLTVCVVLAAAAGGFSNSAPDAGGLLVVLVIGLAAVLLGLALIPVRGWFLRRNFERRVRGFRDEYVGVLRRACDELVAHGVQLRRDATAPFTRLVVAQRSA